MFLIPSSVSLLSSRVTQMTQMTHWKNIFSNRVDICLFSTIPFSIVIWGLVVLL